MYEAIDQLIDEGCFFEMKKLFAPEIITGLARIEWTSSWDYCESTKSKRRSIVCRFCR